MGDLSFHLRIAVSHRRELSEILGARSKALPSLDAIAFGAEALQDLLRTLPVLPEVRLCRLGL
jgi:hypothetical protein